MKQHAIRVLVAASFIILISIFHACAPATYERPKIDLVWPLPPDEPRIKFVDIFASSLDFGKSRSFSSALFGEEDVEGFNKPYGVAVDKEGRIYVTDIGRVFVIDLQKKDYELLGTEAGSGRLAIPIGITVAQDGRVFVADTAQDRVFVYSEKKFVTAIGKTGELESPSGVALDEKRGLIYIVDSKKHMVSIYSLKDYSKIRAFGQRGGGPGEFNYPTNITLDKDGKVYVVDTANFRVQIFDPEGKHLKTIGSLGDTPGSLARPKGIGVDSEGHIYVVDTAFQNFQIFDQEGNVLLFVGGAGYGPGKFGLPAGLTIDENDRIYVIDQIPANLQIFQYLGDKAKKTQGLEQKQK
jgi:DNA-binding beta-propeller fold protein YncE